jgi:ribose transport system substrate-binding protein
MEHQLMKTKRLLSALLASALVAAIVVTAASASSHKASTSSAKVFRIALANSFIGNTWRLEMENIFKAGCQMPPYNKEISCSVFNSGNDVATQTQQISNLISQGVNAIVIDAASATGLNAVVAQACARGIVVVSFDNVVTAPCGQTVNTNQLEFGKLGAQFLVNKLHGKGNVVMVTGVPGTFGDTQRNLGVLDVFKANPGIHVVAKYSGMWDSATAESTTAAQLPSLPKINGIWVSGGTDGVMKALVDAKYSPLPVMAGEAENGFRRYLLPGGYNSKTVVGQSLGQPPFLSLASLQLALEILQKKHAKTSVVLPFPIVNNQTVKLGKTVFSTEPDSFFDDFTDSGPKATVVICLKAALTGTACPGSLHIQVP